MNDIFLKISESEDLIQIPKIAKIQGSCNCYVEVPAAPKW